MNHIKISAKFTMLMLSLVIQGCSQVVLAEPVDAATQFVACTDPRPAMCTREYRPVCGRKDTKIRCVTTPCNASENVSYGNACTACSDKLVDGYLLGECELPESVKP